MMQGIIDKLTVKINALELEAKISSSKLRDKDQQLRKYKDICLKTKGGRQTLPGVRTKSNGKSSSPMPNRF